MCSNETIIPFLNISLPLQGLMEMQRHVPNARNSSSSKILVFGTFGIASSGDDFDRLCDFRV